ncbi:hypothetical protein H6P81_018028 [Aristolochia fimbriata]|uniref:Uncharacterized protein n=1 Tax=Aristolochia fimbriata TaxID=158543 RepID=A0AAV7E079_ARIFI|nr:hypothetical protein H6P81_018028 [Aristolochia fimbriata]
MASLPSSATCRRAVVRRSGTARPLVNSAWSLDDDDLGVLGGGSGSVADHRRFGALSVARRCGSGATESNLAFSEESIFCQQGVPVPFL